MPAIVRRIELADRPSPLFILFLAPAVAFLVTLPLIFQWALMAAAIAFCVAAVVGLPVLWAALRVRIGNPFAYVVIGCLCGATARFFVTPGSFAEAVLPSAIGAASGAIYWLGPATDSAGTREVRLSSSAFGCRLSLFQPKLAESLTTAGGGTVRVSYTVRWKWRSTWRVVRQVGTVAIRPDVAAVAECK